MSTHYMHPQYTAKAIAKKIKISHKKLTWVANLIKGMSVSDALTQLQFCRKRVAINEVYKCLQSAIANAENNKGLDIDNLFVRESTVGQSMRLKRISFRARGRANTIQKRYSDLRILLEERQEV